MFMDFEVTGKIRPQSTPRETNTRHLSIQGDLFNKNHYNKVLRELFQSTKTKNKERGPARKKSHKDSTPFCLPVLQHHSLLLSTASADLD